ncbi:hypothetical protein Goklo_006404 [Gossypium klotzschianum]|uniref:RNase H type-1 domain-containing protein n=1 Tax=Gossypium klotzschianum TaxID=34286 RepID=A0A7J8VIE9_9ROSI|nr:hypothetical protein [Gossypium klotzschianum]
MGLLSTFWIISPLELTVGLNAFCPIVMVVAFDSVKIGGVSRVLMVMPYVLLLSLFRKLKSVIFGYLTIVDRMWSMFGCCLGSLWLAESVIFRFSPMIRHELLPINVKISAIKYNAARDCSRSTFKGKEKDPRVIWEIACKLNDDFKIHNLSLRPILPRVPRDCKWETALEGVSKVNIDVSVKDNKTGLSIILRDSNDFVLCGKTIFIDKAANPKLAELDALLVGIRLAQSLKFDKVIFEIDCACIINRLCKHKDDITIFGHHIKEVREMLNSFSKAEVK